MPSPSTTIMQQEELEDFTIDQCANLSYTRETDLGSYFAIDLMQRSSQEEKQSAVRSTWVDERCIDQTTSNEERNALRTGIPKMQPRSTPFSASELYQLPRDSPHDVVKNADRRLIYIRNLHPEILLALAKTDISLDLESQSSIHRKSTSKALRQAWNDYPLVRTLRDWYKETLRDKYPRMLYAAVRKEGSFAAEATTSSDVEISPYGLEGDHQTPISRWFCRDGVMQKLLVLPGEKVIKTACDLTVAEAAVSSLNGISQDPRTWICDLKRRTTGFQRGSLWMVSRSHWNKAGGPRRKASDLSTKVLFGLFSCAMILSAFIAAGVLSFPRLSKDFVVRLDINQSSVYKISILFRVFKNPSRLESAFSAFIFPASICLYHQLHAEEEKKAHFMLIGLLLPLLIGIGLRFDVDDVFLLLPWGVLMATIASSLFHFGTWRSRERCGNPNGPR